MKKERTIDIRVVLILTFVVLTTTLFFLLDRRQNHNQQQQLQLITERFQIAYNTIYSQHRQLAVVLHSGIMRSYDIPELYQQLSVADKEQKNQLRKGLLSRIKPRYEALQKQAKVRQLHFHLRNNESFLRLHRPGEFGDNLTTTRETVNYVNTEYLPIDGFEEGRVFNGYRFVFPITAADQSHLGSMEISFGPEALTSAMMRQYSVLSNFLIKEETVNKKLFPGEQEKTYRKSFRKGYLFDKNVLAAIKGVSLKELKELRPQEVILDTLFAKAHGGQAVSLYDTSTNAVYTAIPVYNPVTEEMIAFFTVRSFSKYFLQERQHFRILFSLYMLLLIMILSTFYLQHNKRKLVESNAKQLEKQRKLLLDAQKIANLGHWEIDLDTNEASWSELVSEVFGLRSEGLTASTKTFLTKVHPADRLLVKTTYADSLKNHQPYDFRHRIITRDGTEKWIRQRGASEYDTVGKAVRSFGTVQDITLYRQAESRRIEHHEQLITLMETLPDAVFLKDGAGRWLLTNTVARALFQIEEYSWQNRTDRELGSERPNFRAVHETCTVSDEVAWKKKSISIGHEELIAPDGQIHTFEVRKMPIFDSDGTRKALVIIGRDISSRITVENEKETLTKQLHLAKKMESIGLMAGGVAHDLNNILAGIVGYPELLLQELPEDSKLREPIEAIRESGKRADAIVADLLTVARGVASTREVYNLNTLTQEYLNSPECRRIKSLYPKVICQCQLEAAQSNILCSPVHVKKCLMNLALNAAEAIVGEGTVLVSTENQHITTNAGDKLSIEPGEYVVISVRDTGSGISTTDLDHIFEPFYTKKTMGRSGTGLGLAVVWNTMEDHAGKVMVDSSDSGTCFQLFFPISEEKGATRSRNKATVKLRGSSDHILVIDDEPQLRDLASRMLRSMGYKVDSVCSGELALTFVQENPVDLIVLDMQMDPGMNGLQTYTEILKLYPEQKAVIASGYSESDDVKATLRLGAKGFIKKPYSMGQLSRVVQEALTP